MPSIRRALSKYAVPPALAALIVAPAVGAGAPPTFAPHVDYPLHWGPDLTYGVADFNADGHLDVALSSDSAQNDFAILAGNGDGTLGAATYEETMPLSAGGYLPMRATVGDLNRDGRPDLAFSGYGANFSQVLLNQSMGGAFNFTAPVPVGLYAAPQSPSQAAVGDVNADGTPDLVQTGGNSSLCNDGGAVLVRLGNGDGTFGASSPVFSPPNPIACNGSGGAAIGDVNGDGRADVVAISNSDGATPAHGAFLVGLGNGDGTFQPAASYVLTGRGPTPSQISLADLDDDGHLDVIVGAGAGDGVSTLLGNGDGTFGVASVNTSLAGWGMSIGDLNGDGLEDAVMSDWTANAVNVAVGNGDGTFGTAVSVSLPAGSDPWGSALGDLNADGLDDILVGRYTAQKLSVLINTSPLPAPTVTSLAPSVGSTTGGTSVAITGTRFTGASAVTFGGEPATAFTVTSPTTITAVTPAHAAGTVSIEVTTAHGTGASAGAFTFQTPEGSAAPAGEQAAATPEVPSPGSAATTRALTTRAPRLVGRVALTTGAVPTGADRVVQTATAGAAPMARLPFAARPPARVAARCPISRRGRSRTFTCRMRLAVGRWTLTTSALNGKDVLASSVSRVRVTSKGERP